MVTIVQLVFEFLELVIKMKSTKLIAA